MGLGTGTLCSQVEELLYCAFKSDKISVCLTANECNRYFLRVDACNIEQRCSKNAQMLARNEFNKKIDGKKEKKGNEGKKKEYFEHKKFV